jgi:hypothetical protein
MVFLDSSPLPHCGSRKGEPVGARFSEPPKKEVAGSEQKTCTRSSVGSLLTRRFHHVVKP